jgi:hypothetical protein
LDRRLIWPQGRSHVEEEKEIPLQGIKPPSDSKKNANPIMLLMMILGVMIMIKLIICE